MNQNFKGFRREALQFLIDIKVNNSKVWYQENKKHFQQLLLMPFQELVSDLSDFMLTIDPKFITTPMVDKTISRIYRDTRFSKDKSLYRDSIWLTFKRPSEEWKEAPAYFFEVSPNCYRYGMGFYSAPKMIMDRFRQMIDAKSDEFLKVISFYQKNKVFVLEGERYKKVLQFDQREEIREWYQYKSFYLVSNHKIDDLLFSKRLVPELITGFGLLAPLYNYLWEVKRQVEAEINQGY